MNHYLRLLFVSFVLLLLMGLNESQSADCGSSLPVAKNLPKQSVLAGTLPAEEWVTSEPVLPVVYCLQALKSRENSGQRESIHSLAVRTRIICCTGEFREQWPGIAWKTGQFLHFQSSKGDSSRS
ncbi:MAG: hypothetical protein V2B15_10080 [Bacteroidota bacterium]